MGNKCKTCAHPRRGDIDRDLVAGIALRTIAAEYGVSHVALGRHFRNGHITSQMQEQYHAEGLIEREEITAQVKDLQRLLHSFLREANDSKEVRDVLLLTREIRALIELLGKLLGRFPKEPEINILVNPTWISLKQEIFQALEPFPDAKTAVFAAIAGGDLSTTQKQMIAGEPEYKPITPGVKALIDHMFKDHPEEYHPEDDELPEAKPGKPPPGDSKKKGWKQGAEKPIVESRICLRCLKAHSFRGKLWSAGQIWDSSDPDGPKPGGENWELFNPPDKKPKGAGRLLPTRRR